MAQNFSGTCNVVCQNAMSDIDVDIINSRIGGDITLSQSCSTNATCLFNNNMDATADVIFKVKNTTNAKNAEEIGGIDIAETDSRQDIREAINQSSTEKCNIGSYNQMNDVTIFAENSDIGGGIAISQQGSTVGRCQLNNTMKAAAYASGMAQNTTTSGKDKKGEKFGQMSTVAVIMIYVVIAIVLIVAIIVIAKVVEGNLKKKKLVGAEKKAMEARARAGCPGGYAPMKDKSGKIIIDPATGGPICPDVGGEGESSLE